MAKTIKSIDDLIPDAHNANKGTARGRAMIERSIRECGAGRSIVVDREGRVIGGNKTLEVIEELGIPVHVVPTDGNTLVVVQRTDLDLESDPKARKLAYLDNRTGELDLAWDASQLVTDLEAGFDFDGLFTTDELTPILADAANDLLKDERDAKAQEPEDAEPELTRADVPDALWPTDNEWGVPLLDIAMQAKAVDMPFMTWGSFARQRQVTGTYHFYTDDARFTALWADPTPVVLSGCSTIVEPNFSIYEDMPAAVALWRIYMKRWLARWWQSMGLYVFADLNVADTHSDLNMLGIPHGWKAYAIHGNDSALDGITRDYERAQARAGTESILFVVYGGGKATHDYCQERGWVYIMEDRDVAKGRKLDGRQ